MFTARHQVMSLVLGLASYAALATTPAYGLSHAFINSQRSSQETHVFVTQEVEGEYGRYSTTPTEDYPKDQIWKGYGFRTSLGLEFMKFIEFSAGHQFQNMRNQDNALEKLSGSRVNGQIALNFQAPIGDLQAGMGVLASRLDYSSGLDAASFYGSGSYYTLGMNHFLSTRVSIFGNAKVIHENLLRTSGTAPVENLKTNTTAFGLGFNLWL